jgi:tyrosine-protein kinase Etk/Wzc
MQLESEPNELTVLSRAVSSPSISSLLEARWRLLAGAAVVGALLGALAGLVLPSWYESTARLAAIPVDDPTGNRSTNAVDGASATVPMLAALLRSRPVLDETVARLGLTSVYRVSAEKARAELFKHVKVTSDKKANIVTVAVEDRLPTRARDLAATVAELAGQRCMDLWSARNREHRKKLEAELALVSQRLNRAEEALRNFREQNQVVDLATQIKASVETAAALEKERIDHEVGLHFLQGFGGKDSVEVQRALRQRQAVKRALEQVVLGPQRRGPLLPLESLPPLELTHSRLKRAVDVEATRFDALSQKIGELRALEARPDGRPELVDPAALPSARTRPSRLIIAQGAIVSTLLVALFVWLWARRRNPHGRGAACVA